MLIMSSHYVTMCHCVFVTKLQATVFLSLRQRRKSSSQFTVSKRHGFNYPSLQ